MDSFPYTPLQTGRELRLLKLAGGEENSGLKGELIHFNLDRGPDYSALSYVWGSKIAPTKIECNGYQVEITENLADALRHLRYQSESRHLWVDALCINQQDADEKSHQVALMKDIYAHAQEVDVWLGLDEEGIAVRLFAEAENLLASLEAKVEQDVESLDGAQWQCFSAAPFFILPRLSLLFKREYFTRTWVIQEVGLANRPVAHCGKATVNFNKLGLFAMAFLKYFRPTLSSLGYLKEFECVSSLYQTYLPQPGPERLYDIIHRTRLNQVTDSRDKVYAFISHPSARQDVGGFPYSGEGMPHGGNMTEEDIRWRALSIIFAPTNVT
ncbi:hypothetical protein O1611_g1501 [Lasiodiplodia mahajangana]|uniref:Uncharacterized protein n=1 Tax=Lasiodiplodia mahajangana TaxID=1108764 RepID=A0ACC2JXE1_9PEZI|nr:hypothetical protein O1611_g1501 [Lasiodiplodia mahajangana]